MMLSLRVLKQRLWLVLGLILVIAGGTAATMGYLAAREAARIATLVATTPAIDKAQPTTKKASTSATTRTSIRTSRSGSAGRGATTRKSNLASAKPTTRSAPTTTHSTPVIANANVNSVSLGRWHGMMWWGGAVLVVGVVSVAYSVHQMREKPIPTGADELLNDAVPF